MRTPFEEVIARAIEEGGRVHSRTVEKDGATIEESSFVTETVVFDFGTPAAAERALRIIRQQIRRQFPNERH